MTGTEDAQPARDVAEALAWFREQPDALVDLADPFLRGSFHMRAHAATIVRAALAAAPLTANNIRDAHTAYVRLPLVERDAWPDWAAFVAARLSEGRADVAAEPEHNHLNSGVYGGCPACGTDYPERRDWVPGTGRHDPMSEPPKEQR